jgi:hypothetical protein
MSWIQDHPRTTQIEKNKAVEGVVLVQAEAVAQRLIKHE